jgi:two-component system sensor histidine kinase UhpB
MTQKLNILIIEDNPDDADMMVRQLTSTGIDPQWSRVDTEQDFLAALQKQPSIILADYSMPLFSGLRALELIRVSGLDIPLILISGTIGEDVAVEAMKFGATDYLLKDRIVRLPGAVERALKDKQLRDKQRLADDKIKGHLHELQRWEDVTLDREERVHALKKEVNEALMLAGKPPRYTDKLGS